jgi:hypothetical protein
MYFFGSNFMITCPIQLHCLFDYNLVFFLLNMFIFLGHIWLNVKFTNQKDYLRQWNQLKKTCHFTNQGPLINLSKFLVKTNMEIKLDMLKNHEAL